MSRRLDVPLSQAYLLLNHGPVVLVSSASGGRRNVMAASWSMPLDFEPPKVAVVIDSRTLTRELIEASGEFVLNVPPVALATTVLAVGTQSGRDIDKFASFDIGCAEAKLAEAPLIDACVAWLECRVVSEPHNQGRYDLFIGEVVAASAGPHVFVDGAWRFTDDSLRTIHYQSGGAFFATGEPFRL